MSAENETDGPNQTCGLKFDLPKSANETTRLQLGRHQVVEYISQWRGGPHSPKTFVEFSYRVKAVYSTSNGTRWKSITFGL